jgi:hypothetical protein
VRPSCIAFYASTGLLMSRGTVCRLSGLTLFPASLFTGRRVHSPSSFYRRKPLIPFHSRTMSSNRGRGNGSNGRLDRDAGCLTFEGFPNGQEGMCHGEQYETRYATRLGSIGLHDRRGLCAHVRTLRGRVVQRLVGSPDILDNYTPARY